MSGTKRSAIIIGFAIVAVLIAACGGGNEPNGWSRAERERFLLEDLRLRQRREARLKPARGSSTRQQPRLSPRPLNRGAVGSR
jgi:hypothetical protein